MKDRLEELEAVYNAILDETMDLHVVCGLFFTFSVPLSIVF